MVFSVRVFAPFGRVEQIFKILPFVALSLNWSEVLFLTHHVLLVIVGWRELRRESTWKGWLVGANFDILLFSYCWNHVHGGSFFFLVGHLASWNVNRVMVKFFGGLFIAVTQNQRPFRGRWLCPRLPNYVRVLVPCNGNCVIVRRILFGTSPMRIWLVLLSWRGYIELILPSWSLFVLLIIFWI